MPVSDPSFVPVSAWLDGDNTHVRVRFSRKVLANAALTTAANYTIAGNTVTAAAAVSDDPFAVKLTLGAGLASGTSLITVATGVILDSTSTYAITSPGNTVQAKTGDQRAQKPSSAAKVIIPDPIHGWAARGSFPPIKQGVIAAKGTPAPPGSAPSVVNLVPALTSSILPADSIGFDLLFSAAIENLTISIDYAKLKASEVVYRDGVPKGPFTVTITTIGGGWRIAITRAGGWPASPSLVVEAVDSYGRQNP